MSELLDGSTHSDELISLLRSKNRCLERFLLLTEEFSSKEGLDALSEFESMRDSILRTISLYDRKIEEIASLLLNQARDPALAKGARQLIEHREILVNRILEFDAKIVTRIEDERRNTEKELSAAKSRRENLARFKSTWVNESGERIDQKL